MIYLKYLLLGTIRQISSIDSPSKNANGNWKKRKEKKKIICTIQHY